MRFIIALLFTGASIALAKPWHPEADLYLRDLDDSGLEARDFDLEERDWEEHLATRDSQPQPNPEPEADELETRLIHCTCRRHAEEKQQTEQEKIRLPPWYRGSRSSSDCNCLRRRDLEIELLARDAIADPFWLEDLFQPKEKHKKQKDSSLKDDRGSEGSGGDDDSSDSSGSSDSSDSSSGDDSGDADGDSSE